MAQLSQIAQLAERRRLLVAESDWRRRQISAEAANLHTSIVWIERASSLAGAVGVVWLLLAPLARMLIVRKRSSSWFRILRRGWAGWKLGKKLAALWRRRGAESAA